jgi:hypothetical protein
MSKLEFTKDLLSPNEANLLGPTSRTCNQVTDFDVIEPDDIARFSDHYEATIGDVHSDIPGWNWPRCGQSMTLTVGASGASKSTWSVAQGVDVISSDEIRKERSPDGEVGGPQSEIFHEVRMRSAKFLATGDRSSSTRCTLSRTIGFDNCDSPGRRSEEVRAHRPTARGQQPRPSGKRR